jgi:hypothetical protein
LWSLFVWRPSGVRPSVNFYFKWHLLINSVFFSLLGEGGRCPLEGEKCDRRGIFIRI